MSLIDIKNLTFAYDGSFDNIFENVSFQVDTDWKIGFVGRNGRGKTTFLNLLCKKFPFQGEINSRVSFEYFPFEIPNKTEITLKIIENISSDFQNWELVRELSLLNVAEEVLFRPFETLSNGEQTKVLLGTLFLKHNSFLLIDEPTNHLDMEGREVVSRYLNGKNGFILVSHDRAFLDNCVDHILSINKSNIEVQRGNFSSWQLNKQRQDGFELSENEKLRREIKRLEKTAKEKAVWSDKVEATKIGTGEFDRGYIGHKSAKMMKRSKAIEARQRSVVEEKSRLLKNIESADTLKITCLRHHSNRLALLKDVSIFYGEKRVASDINLKIAQGERIALCGKNGSGKTSILKLICGENIARSGTFELASRLKISYVRQDTAHLSGNLTDFALEYDIDQTLFKAILRKLDFSRIQFEKDMSDFSGGQKKKVLIAKSLCERAHLYIWDEPLNYIDVISRIQIEELLLKYRPTMLFVEHDSKFCKNIATKQVILP